MYCIYFTKDFKSLIWKQVTASSWSYSECVPNGSLNYDVYLANGTRGATSQLSCIVTSLVTETRPRQVFRRLYDSWMQHATPQEMWRTVTASAIYTRLTAETWWQQFFRRLSNCDAASLLISLVLVTARLGSEIHARQAISIPKRKMLLISPLRCSAHRDVDRGAFATSRYR